MKKRIFEIPGRLAKKDAAIAEKEKQNLPEARIDKEKNEYIVFIAMPGLERKDFSVSFCDNQLKITGSRPLHIPGTTVKRPIFLNGWEQEFKLPADADTTMTAAIFKNGELEIHIPKGKKTMLATEELVEVYVY